MSRSPSIAVLIASYNRQGMVRRSVRSVLRQRQFSEIVVVDDGSDEPVDLAEFQDSRLSLIRHSANRGVSAARNAGVSRISASHVLFLDDDDVLLPFAGLLASRWLAARGAREQHRRIVVGGVLVSQPGRRPHLRRPPSSRAGQIWGLDEDILRSRQTFATKQAAMIPAELFREVGGFDENLRTRTASELFFRLTEIADVEGRAWPIYNLNRGPHEKLTADPVRRETSVAYIREKHAGILSDPRRRLTFERNHQSMMRKSGIEVSLPEG